MAFQAHAFQNNAFQIIFDSINEFILYIKKYKNITTYINELQETPLYITKNKSIKSNILEILQTNLYILQTLNRRNK